MQEIRHVAIGRFQRNIYRELDNLPFIITKDGEDYCVVTKPFQAIEGKQKGTVNVSPGMPKSEDVTVTATAIDAFQNYPLVGTSGGKLKNIGIDMAEEGSRDLSVGAGRCQPQNTTCKYFGIKYRVTYPGDEGEVKKDVFLCKIHVKQAKDSDMEIAEV